MNVRISARARDDFDHLYALVLDRLGKEAADEFLISAQGAIELLVKHPEAGPRPGWATRHKGLRFWIISQSNYLIFYFPEKDGVSIERVLDGRRDVKRIINRRMENPDDRDEL